MNTYLAFAAVIAFFLVIAAPALVGLAHERRVDRQLRAARAAEAARDEWIIAA
jgi:hypothetical protein